MPIIVTQNKTVKVNYSSDIPKMDYHMNDLDSVYTHYNPETGKNEPTENKLKEIKKYEKNS